MCKSFILTTTIIAFTKAIEPATIQIADGPIRDVVYKHIKNIPDIENQYVVNEKLSKAISRYFNGKISMLPLYKLSLTVDRNPLKIPWSLAEMNDTKLNNVSTVTETINTTT